MPFKPRARRSMRRRRTMRRRRGGQSTRAIAVRALRATDQERKFSDTSFSSVAVNDTLTGASIFHLNGVPANTSNEGRIGKKLAMRSLWIQLALEKAGTSTSQVDFIRLMVILDRQPNGELPVWSQILDLPGTGNSLTELNSPNQLGNSKRFQTLWDHRITLFDNFKEGVFARKFLSMSQTAQYNNSGAGIADINTNSLLLCLIGSVVTGGTVPEMSGVVRLRFVG